MKKTMEILVTLGRCLLSKEELARFENEMEA